LALARTTVYHSIPFDLKNFVASMLRPQADATPEAEAQVEQLEASFAAYMGASHAVAFSLARSAVYHALKSRGFSPGSAIIMPPITIKPMMDAVVHLGLRPIFVDIEPHTLCFDPDQLEAAIGRDAKAILITYLFGMTPDMTQLMDICRRHDLFVIEDFSHNLNAAYQGQKLGTFGDVGIYSASATKTFDAYGGGLLITDDDQIEATLRAVKRDLAPASAASVRAKILRDLVWNVASHKWVWTVATFPFVRLLRRLNPELEAKATGARVGLQAVDELGPEFNERMTERQARTGIELLGSVEENDRRRIAHANEVRDSLDGEPYPVALPEAHNVYWQCLLYCSDPVGVKRILARHGVDAATTNLSLISALGIYPEYERACPVAEYVKKNALFVPVYPNLRRRDVERVKRALAEAMPGRAGRVDAAAMGRPA
jgi:dTDP-4-amino-4,6-dideoxygalactose transaminase